MNGKTIQDQRMSDYLKGSGRCLPENFPGGITGVPAKIRTEHLPRIQVLNVTSRPSPNGPLLRNFLKFKVNIDRCITYVIFLLV
jgi:hypothetical protein